MYSRFSQTPFIPGHLSVWGESPSWMRALYSTLYEYAFNIVPSTWVGLRFRWGVCVSDCPLGFPELDNIYYFPFFLPQHLSVPDRSIVQNAPLCVSHLPYTCPSNCSLKMKAESSLSLSRFQRRKHAPSLPSCTSAACNSGCLLGRKAMAESWV